MAFHVLGVDGPRLGGAVEWETDRARFIGRGRSLVQPAVVLDGRALSGTTGAVLDPIGALRERIRLAPGASMRITFATGVAPDRAAALALARKYRDGSAAARAFSMAFTHVHITLQHLGLSDEDAILFDRLASRVFGADNSLLSPPDLAANRYGQQNLWGQDISGDLPIVLVRVGAPASLPLVRQLLNAQEYWRVKGLRADLVILNEQKTDYLDEMQHLLTAAGAGVAVGRLVRQAGRHVPAARRGHGRRPIAICWPPWRASCCPAISATCPRSWSGRRRGCTTSTTCRARPSCACRTPSAEPVAVPELVMENGLGGFTPDGREYVVVLDGERETPLPWSNVLANPGFGTIVSSAGSAFTWAGNSRENRLTPFANDPLIDPTGEAIFLRDEDLGAVWGATPAPLPRRADGGRWVDSARARA